MRIHDHLRVVELSRSSAAAFAGRLWADAGAEVILVEPPAGHALRAEGPFASDRPDYETSAPHLHINAGKRSVVIDIDAESALLTSLVLTADVFLTDVPDAEIALAGLSWPALHAKSPGLVMTRITPFGETGPYRSYAGTNLVCMALGGQLKITGDPGRAPLQNFGAQAEYQAGLAAFAGTLANLLIRDVTGEGEYLDLAIQDIVSQNLEGRSLTFNLGVMAERAGLNVSAVYGVYPCADGWVFISAFAPALWDQLKAAIGLPELDDARYGTQAGRLDHNDELQAIITGWTLARTADELRKLSQQGFPLTVAETPAQLLASEQWRGRHVVHRVRHPAAGEVVVLGRPWIEETPAPPAHAPLVGADTRSVLAALREVAT